MKLSLELSPEQASRLQDEAKRIGVPLEDLAKAALVDLLNGPREDFRAALQTVLDENRELYRRLS